MGDRPKRGAARGAAAVIVVALLVGGVAVARVGFAVYPALSGPTFATPGTQTYELEGGRYAVFEATGTNRQLAGVSVRVNGFSTIEPDDVVVTSPTGVDVPVGRVRSNETIQRDGLILTAAVEFTVTEAGPHRVEVVEGTQPSTATVARELGDLFVSLAAWFVLLGLAAVTVVVAAVVLLVSILRSGGGRSATPPPSGAV